MKKEYTKKDAFAWGVVVGLILFAIAVYFGGQCPGLF